MRIAGTKIGIAVVRVVHALPRQVAEELEEQLLALVRVTYVAPWRRHRIENVVKARLGAIRITLIEELEAHRNIAAIAALGAAETFTVVVIVVVYHQADLDALERVEDFAHGAAQHIEECVWTHG